MSRKRSGSPISLFSFQDAITSVCGVVVLITLILALDLTNRVVDTAARKEVAKERVEETKRQIEALRENLAAVDATCVEMRETNESLGMTLPEARAALANAKKRLEAAREEKSKLEKRLDEAREEEATFQDQEKMIEETKEESSRERKKAEETVARTFDSQTSALYAFPESVREKPWYVDVSGSRVVAYSSDGEIAKKEFETAFSFTQWATSRSRSDEYFVLIVRPSGVKNYEFIREELEESSHKFGIDLIGEKKTLNFLPARKER